MRDPKLGKHGEYEPKCCAVSSKKLVLGAVGHSLGNGWYCKVNAKYNRRYTDELGKALLTAQPKAAPAKATVKKSEVSK